MGYELLLLSYNHRFISEFRFLSEKVTLFGQVLFSLFCECHYLQFSMPFHDKVHDRASDKNVTQIKFLSLTLGLLKMIQKCDGNVR